MTDYFGFTRDEPSIIAREDVLMTSHLPDHMLYRDSQLKAIADAIKPMLKKGYADNLFIHGNSGTGKTSGVKFIIRQMRAHSDNVLPVYVNCWENYTQAAVYSRIIEEMHLPLPRRGIASDEQFDRIIQYARNYEKPILLVLDELDGLRHDKLLYSISRANEKEGVLFGIISMTNNKTLLSGMDARIRSSLRFSEMEFPDYSADEIFGIIRSRAEAGLVPGSWDERLLRKIAESSEDGSARIALQYLWKAAKRAESKSQAKIMIQDFEDVIADDPVPEPEVMLTAEEEIIIELLRKKDMDSTELYDEFRKKENKTKRQIRNYLEILEKKGLIISSQSSKNGILNSRIISLRK
jgi:cell division control protein 6